MPSQKCYENVRAEEPPDNVLCTDAFCASIQSNIDSHCTKRHLDPDTPFGSMDPNLHGPGKGGFCYCCCSCFAYDTPIEAAPGRYVLAQDVEEGDEVLAAGVDLKWLSKPVEMASGWSSTTVPIPGMYIVRYEWIEGAEKWREVIVTADHLFLREDKTLQAVQTLAPNDVLLRSDGGKAKVLFVAVGSLLSGVHSIQMGPFDGKDLNGHLLNTNGVVTADYAVQVYYASGSISKTLLHAAKTKELEVGTREYHAAHPSVAYDAFLNDRAQWPKAFMPLRRSAIQLAPDAKSYFTQAQAEDIEANAPRRGPADTFPAQAALYLYNVTRGFCRNVTLLLDWTNDLPNAYSWHEWDQQIIVLTGGLVRIIGLSRSGLALILSTQLAYRTEEIKCVGPADYYGLSFVMREMWNGDLFFKTVKSGFDEVKKLFSYVSKANSGEDPLDICGQPSLECREETYQAAMSMFDIPGCAVPVPHTFKVIGARARGLLSVEVRFDEELDVPTAETIANYTIEPGVTVTKAKVNPRDAMAVMLTVRGLAGKKTYLVAVHNVVTVDNVPLDPKHDTVTFKT